MNKKQMGNKRSDDEQALLESEERFRAFVLASSDVVYRMSPDWKEMRYLKGKDFLADTEDSSPLWIEKYILEEDRPNVVATIEAAIRNKSVFELEHRVIRADSTIGWTQSRATPVLNVQGEILEWFGTAKDVTELKRTEEELRQARRAAAQSEQRLQRVLETYAAGVLFFDHSGTLIHANDVFLRMTGYRREQIERRELTWRKMTPPEWIPESEAQIEKFAQIGRTGPYEKEYFLADGSRRWMLFAGRDLGDGTISEYCIDITDRKQAEEALRASEEKYRTLFDSMDEGFVIVELLFDAEGKPFDLLVLETNTSFDRMMRTTNAVGKRALEIFLSAESSWFEAYGRVVETGQSLRLENYLAPLDRWFDLYISRIGGAGSRRFAIGFNDITDRRRQEANLALLAEVSQALADLTNIDETMAVLGERICKHFGAVLCAFSDIDETEEIIEITHEWKLPELPSWKGVYPVREIYTEDFLRAMHAEETYVVRDTQADPRINAENMAAIGIRSFVTVPLLRNGAWCYNLSVADTAPRDWRADEIELMRELTTRIWTRIERVRAEEDLRRSEARLRLIIESAKGYAIFTTDANGVINSWNAVAAHTFGWSEAEILGQSIAVLFMPEDRAAGEPEKELETARAEGIASDVRWHLRKDGSRVFINGVVHLMSDGPRTGFLKIGRDLTAQRQSEEALRESQKQLQVLNETLEQRVQEKTAEVHQLASDLIETTQRERQRISRVLHDDLQQRVFAVQMQLSFLRDGLPSESDSARKEASDIRKKLAEIVNITRNLSIDLSPPILPEEGLSHAIEWLATRMREQYGLPVELQANGPFVVPNEELHVLLFNCVRELLFNVVKHAGASRAVVALAWLDNDLRIEIRDDGKGFSINPSEESISKQEDLPRSLGLPTIRHQFSLFRGRMEINSKPGAGTQIILIVPVAQAQQGVSSSAATP